MDNMILEHYQRLVDYFINLYKFKANIISYKDFLVGCSIFEIGYTLGFKQPMNYLADFLLIANVQTKTKEELQQVREVRTTLLNERENIVSELNI